MSILDEYEKIPAELSGASSKNRFRYEMFWGASKMFDLLSKEDFCVIFDYKCDIEVHFSDALEFYQVKTHKVQSPYTLSTLAKKGKDSSSIIGKLFILKNATDPSTPIKIAIVSNAYLKIGKTVYSEFEEIDFNSLDSKVQTEIRNSLKDELGNNIDLTNVGFIYTSMNLLNPENDLKGKIIGTFESIMGCEPEKPNALYRLIKDTVETKACYELKSSNYEDLKRNKGITKQELYDMLCKHATFADTAISEAEKFIDSHITAPKAIRQYKTSLVSITEYYSKSNELKSKEKVIAQYLDTYQDDLPDNQIDALDKLYIEFGAQFPIELTESDIRVFLLIVLLKWEGGKYEQINL